MYVIIHDTIHTGRAVRNYQGTIETKKTCFNLTVKRAILDRKN